MLVSLAALWAGSFFFIKLAVGDVGPILLAFARTSIAGLLLLFILKVRAENVEFVKNFVHYFALGGMNAALPFVLIGLSEQKLDVAVASTLNAMTPLFSLVIAALMGMERMTGMKLVALGIGVTGVYFAAGGTLSDSPPISLYHVLASLLAAGSYAAAGVYSKKFSMHMQPLSLACGQQLGAALLLLPFAVLTDFKPVWSTSAIAATLALGIVSTGIAYLLFFRLIASVGPTLTNCVTLLIPLISLGYGYFFLREHLGATNLIGLVMILFGVGILFVQRQVMAAPVSSTITRSGSAVADRQSP